MTFPLRPSRTSPASRSAAPRRTGPAAACGHGASAAVLALTGVLAGLAAAPPAFARAQVVDETGAPVTASRSASEATQATPDNLLAPPPLIPTDGSRADLPPLLARPAPRPPPPPPGADGLGPQEIYLEADVLTDDRARKLVTGEGHVEARVEGRTLRANRIVYDTVSGLVRAQGDVVIVNADGTTEFAQDTVLDDQLRAGVATGFSARLDKNTVVAAGTAIKRNENVTAFKSAILTPCPICKADGVTPKTPTFSIKADRIVQDKVRSVVYYHHAVIRVLGAPIFYTPLLWTPDPTADRRSGLLAPRISVSKRRGFSYEQPYYLALSDYADLTIAPQINTAVNPLLNVQYRERFYSGALDIRAGYTHEQIFDTHGKYGDDTNRSYILAKGAFDLTRAWDWGFGVERVTDPTFFRRYSIPTVYTDRGPFPADTDRLISQLYTRWIDDDLYLSAAALSFQSLRAYGSDPMTGRPLFESNKGFPYVTPLLEARFDPQAPVFGGRLRITASAVDLQRDNDVLSIQDRSGLLPQGPERPNAVNLGLLTNGGSVLDYTDSRRASAQVEWRRDFTLSNGIRLQPYLQARGDVYGVDDAKLTTLVDGVSTTRPADGTTTRGDGTVGVTASWPFYRPLGSGSVILEPIVQLAYSPRIKLDPTIPNEEDVAFEFDETNLFTFNRLPGNDLYESGARANIGGRADFLWGANHTATITAGRVFRTAPDPALPALSGLQGTSSDWVYGATVSPLNGLSFFVRQRLDADTLAVRRDEAGFGVAHGPVNFGLRYLYNESGLSINSVGVTQVGRVEDVVASGSIALTRNWQLSGTLTRDLQSRVFPQTQMILTYHDECVRVDAIYTHDETYSTVIGTSDSLTLRLTLAILGDTRSSAGRTR